YRAHVARSANIDKLLTDGRSQLSRGDYALAAVSFKQATLLDPNFRDSCLGWAYAAAMVAAKGDASDSEMSDARTALAKARQLDPTNPTVKQFEAVLANTQHHS
ncbi:MAG: hypothetical protein KGI38_12875, partial [Thaumarchaeota archaeon]|nr:hypothetical protein [Nitrososphaerota archaeon]